MHGYHDDDINRQKHTSTSGDKIQAPDVSERFYNLFTGNERRHVKSFGPPVKGKNKRDEDKWKLKVVTDTGPASLALWHQHLDHKFILSIIPRLVSVAKRSDWCDTDKNCR